MQEKVIKASPMEFLALPVNGEPYIPRNNVAMQQDWCEKFTIKDILDQEGNFRKPEDYPQSRRLVFYENTEIESALKDFINSCQQTCGSTHAGCIKAIGT